MRRFRLFSLLAVLLCAASMWAATDKLSGEFSVSSQKKVKFSRGNLQYYAASKTWRFAEHQYDFIGNNLGNWKMSDRDTQENWIDLFGWGTGTSPYTASSKSSDYLPEIKEQYEKMPKANEWGTAVKSQLGAGWFTLDYSEWFYLVLRRPNAAYLRQLATVCGVQGMILMPDGWEGTLATSYDATAWAALEAQNAVFLPCAGSRGSGASIYDAGSKGYYWSRDAENARSSWVLEFAASYFRMNVYGRETGMSVRLVANAIEGLIYPDPLKNTYDGTVKTLITAGECPGYTFKYKIGEDGTWSTELPTAIIPGTYTIYFECTADGKDNIAGSITSTIEQAAELKITKAPELIPNLYETGDTLDIIIPGEGEGVFFYSVSGSPFSTELPRLPDAHWGAYSVTYYMQDANRYHKPTEQVTLYFRVDFPIAKIKEEPRLLQDSGEYDRHTYTYYLRGKTDDGMIYYSLNPDGPWDWQGIGTEATNPGVYTVYYYVRADNVHQNSPVYHLPPYTIYKRRINWKTEPQMLTPSYDGTPQALCTEGTADYPVYQYYFGADPTFRIGADGEWVKKVPTATEPGTYDIYYYLQGDFATYDTEIKGPFQVTLGSGTLAYEAPVGLTLYYNGEDQELIENGTITSAGKIEGCYFEYSLNGTDWSKELPTAKEQGTYDIYYRIIGDGTYYKTTEYDPEHKVVATIGKPKPEYTAPTARELNYTGEPQALIDAGTTEHGTFEYSLDGENWMTTLPTGLEVGDYTVYYRIKADEFHGDIPFSEDNKVVVSISKTAPHYTAPTAKTLTYNGAEQELVLPGTTEDGTFEYSLDGENWSTTIPTGLKPDTTYNVHYRIIGDENHNNLEDEAFVVEVTIAKAAPEVTAPEALELVYNGDNQTLTTAGATTGGTLLYTLTPDDEESWATTLPAGLNAGEYTVYYKVKGDDNYLDAEPASVIASIAKADIDLNGGGDDPVSLTLPKAIEGLKYTGEKQTLIEAGESSDGTFLYSLDGENWADTLPKGLEAGKYNVYYKVQGDANHNDSEVGGPIEVTIAKAESEYTEPEAIELTYNGEPQMPVVPGTSEDGKFQYSPDGENWTDTVPNLKDAGEYSIYYRFVGDENHEDGEPESVIVTIAKAAPEFTAPEANEPTYNGEPQALIAAGTTEDGYFEYSMDGENWSATIPTATDAGEYTVYYRVIGDANHLNAEDEEFAVAVTIAKAAPEFTAPMAMEPTYNGEPQALIAAGTTEDGYFEYSLDGENWSTEIPTATDAGEYTVYYRVIGDDNHLNAEDEEFAVAVTIAKAAPEFTAPVANEPTYNEQPQALVTAGATEDGTMLYSMDGENWSETIPTATNAGEYTVYYKVQGDENHKDSEPESVIVTLAKATPEFTAPEANEPTYNGEPQALIAAGTTEDGYFEYSLDGENWSTEIPTATDAGEYTVYYRVIGDENHLNAEDEEYVVTVSIAKAAPEFTAPMVNELTYNGEPRALVTAGITNDGNFEYSLDGENWSTEIPTATDAGEYTVYYRVIGDDNHLNAEDEEFAVAVTIAKAAPEFTAPVANEPTYNEQSQALVAAGTTEDGYFEYSVDGENWSTEIPTATNAGEYTVYYRVIGDDNHLNAEDEEFAVAVTIAKAAPKFTAPVANEPTYNEQPQALVTAGSTEDGTMLYSLDGENWSTEIPTATNAGDYTVYYKVQGDANHKDSEVASVIVTIAKAEAAYSAPEANEPTYTDAPQALVAAGSTEDGTMLYSLDGENWSETIPTATNAGEYTVYYKVQGDPNHNDSEVASVSVTIAKAVLSVSDAEVVKAKFADGNADAEVTTNGVLNGVQGDDAITLTTTAAYDNAEVGDGKTITISYTLVADAAVLANYEFPVTSEVYTTEGVIIEQMIPDNEATPEATDQEVKEGIEVNAYGFCHGESYSLGYHLKSGDPNQYKIEFPDNHFTDVDWTNLVINGASGRDGYIDIDVPVDLPTGEYSMTVTFRRYIEFSDGSSMTLESAPFTTSFNVNLPETYTMPLFDNVIALVDTCECLTDVQWYHRENGSQEWQLIPGATDYYYKQEGGLTGEYFAKVKMNGVETFTCPQTDVVTLYGQNDETVKQPKVSVYPNPVVSTATVTIEDSNTFNHILRIVNDNGWQIEQRDFEGMDTTIDLTGCQIGRYMISVDGIVVKVIKK